MKSANIYEILIQARLAELAETALESYKTIQETFENSFGLRKKEIKCYSHYNGDIHSSATLSIDGIWTLHDEYYPHDDIEVSITPSGIFECLKAKFATTLTEENYPGITELISSEDLLLGLTASRIEYLSKAEFDLCCFINECANSIAEDEDNSDDCKDRDHPDFMW
ncbi:MAG: hypothetical protein IKQ33_03915 [Clostridia bacterium]|nr:hypothetical protein [Clostridia bacterium]